MTAPNTQTTSLAKALGDFNPDGLLAQYAKVIAAGAANATIAAANMVNAILTCTQSANITLTTDTAANITAQIGTQPTGACFDLIICANNAANTAVTLAGGTGVTIVGPASVSAASSCQAWRFVVNANGTYSAYGH